MAAGLESKLNLTPTNKLFILKCHSNDCHMKSKTPYNGKPSRFDARVPLKWICHIDFMYLFTVGYSTIIFFIKVMLLVNFAFVTDAPLFYLDALTFSETAIQAFQVFLLAKILSSTEGAIP